MEKGTLGLGIAAAISVFAFFSLHKTQDAERQETRARIERDAAEFDAKFSRAWGDTAAETEALRERAAAAAKKAAAVEEAARIVAAEEQKKRDAVQSAAEVDIAKRAPDLGVLTQPKPQKSN